MSTSYINRARGRSLSQQPSDDELGSIEKQFSFINKTIKWNTTDLEKVIGLLRSRYAAEEAYVNALIKIKKATQDNNNNNNNNNNTMSSSENMMNTETATAKTFQHAVKLYEATMTDMIESRQRLKDTLKTEIEKLTSIKEAEEVKRKKIKAKLSDVNLNYATFRTRDLTKLRKTYIHKCEELKSSQANWQQQLLQQQEEFGDMQSTMITSNYGNSNNNRLSGDFTSRLSGEYTTGLSTVTTRDMEGSHSNEHKKGMAGLISQMRTRATNSHSAPLDQNKQNTKVAKMKKDITDADNDYRDGILTLESLRKKQAKTVEESLKMVEESIKTKSNTVRASLLSITQSEYMTLNSEKEMASRSFSAAKNIDSSKDTLIFTNYYHSLGFLIPQPIRYENFYYEGKCREVLFGGSLESYSIEHNRAVPIIVTKCIDAIENLGGLQKEGIYRISGRQTNVEQLKHQFEMDEASVDMDSFDVFTVATVLKMFIRELKRPLFDLNAQTRLNYSKSMSHNQRLGVLESKLANLSYAHRSTLHKVILHLAKVNEYSQINKMNIQNLAVIFTPVIFHDFNQMEDNSGEWCPDDLFEDLILYHDNLFISSEVLAQKLNEPKLKAALSGQSPYTQFSQSNLLYITRGQPGIVSTPAATPATRNMLLTQPMNPPVVMGSGNDYSSSNTMIPESNMYYSPQPQPQQIPQQSQQQVSHLQQQQPPPPPPQQQQVPQQHQQQQQHQVPQQQQGTAPPALTTIIGNTPTHHQRNSSLSSSQNVYPINRNVANNTPPSTIPTHIDNNTNPGRITPQRYRLDSPSTIPPFDSYHTDQQSEIQQQQQHVQPSVINKSMSDNTAKQQTTYDINAGPYSTDTRMTSSTPTLLKNSRASTEFIKSNIPPRQDSLRKNTRALKNEKTLVQEEAEKQQKQKESSGSSRINQYQPSFNPDFLPTIEDDPEMLTKNDYNDIEKK